MHARPLPIEPEIAYQLVTHQSTNSLIRGVTGSPSTYLEAISEKISQTSDSVCSVDLVSPASFCLFDFETLEYEALTISSLAIKSKVSSTMFLKVGCKVADLVLV